MATVLDFNSVKRPTLDLVMVDDEKTKLSVTLPKEAMIRRLAAGMTDLQEIVGNNDQEGISAIYSLAAELMSCNRQMIQITVDDLRGKFRMELEDLVLFFSTYAEFVGEIKNAKN